jgi:hypothetical protein
MNSYFTTWARNKKRGICCADIVCMYVCMYGGDSADKEYDG